MKAKLVLLPGDGIGREVVEEARRVLEAVADLFDHDFRFLEAPVGGGAIDAHGDPLPKQTLDACREADAALLGAVGGPKWDDPNAKVRPEQGLLRLRGELRLYANLRPVRVYRELMAASPLKADRLEGVDILVVRELTGGLYFGQPKMRDAERAVDTLAYTAEEIRRVVRVAFRLAQGRRRLVTSVDKANVLESSRLWRQVATEVAQEFPGVKLEHQLVDSCAMKLITHPRAFDVVVTENMFGDILTDEAAVLASSLGMLPSASLGDGRFGLYEPVHGSAPDIAGKGVANPIGAVLSTAMLLRHSLGLEEEASCVEGAVADAIACGCHTGDVGGTLATRQMGDAIVRRLGQEPSSCLASYLMWATGR